MIRGLAISFFLLLNSCELNNKWLGDILSMEGAALEEGDTKELKIRLQEVENQAQEIYTLVREKGTLHQRLGMQYLKEDMMGPALEAFLQAGHFYPNSPGTHYYIGLTSGRMYTQVYDPREKAQLLIQAEEAYRKSLELNSRQRGALYGLGVLLHFEKEENEEALELLERLIRLDGRHYKGQFLKARVHYSLGQFAQAYQQYSSLLSTLPEEEADLRMQASRFMEEITTRGEFIQ